MEKPNDKLIEDAQRFFDLGFETIKSLEVSHGVLASSAQEIYGCIFGRDSLITSLKLLKAYEFDTNPYYLYLTRKILEGLLELQGKEINIESGEEPGKCIHEYRATDHEHLTKTSTQPWFMYSDGTMRNFDSIDSTPLLLVSLYRYLEKSSDKIFIEKNIDKIKLSLDWILEFGDKNKDGFMDYQKHPERKSGGLIVQSWMDSAESIFHEDEIDVKFPVAPVEAQAYSYLALKLWAKYFEAISEDFSNKLFEKAFNLKNNFNENFIIKNKAGIFFAHALDSNGKPLLSKRSSIGHILWANLHEDGKPDCILENKYIKELASQIMQPDIFEKEAGIRTLNKSSKLFDPISYHNGSIWPHDNSLIAEGLENFGYRKEAFEIREALFSAYSHFQTPVELFAYSEGNYLEYKSSSGQIACREQAWCAASMIADALVILNYKKQD